MGKNYEIKSIINKAYEYIPYVILDVPNVQA